MVSLAPSRLTRMNTQTDEVTIVIVVYKNHIKNHHVLSRILLTKLTVRSQESFEFGFRFESLELRPELRTRMLVLLVSRSDTNLRPTPATSSTVRQTKDISHNVKILLFANNSIVASIVFDTTQCLLPVSSSHR